jgi:hypothetical protein
MSGTESVALESLGGQQLIQALLLACGQADDHGGLRLRGGGGDGGSTGAESRSSYLEMYKTKKDVKVCPCCIVSLLAGMRVPVLRFDVASVLGVRAEAHREERQAWQ